ncbi:T9SS type B sorting domain-containing protein [Neolewinella persica]|uniref:T9SS type B sorting domain-containing protein n=1 Tax=Neolewinella persica TaxID=70998 RepID=UPI0003647CBA|nr:T9SS type B sorting domain-containing protein [Neolewinella persica]
MLRWSILFWFCSLLSGVLAGQDFPPTTTVCTEGPFTFMSPLTDGQVYLYQWERSFDGGTSWNATGTGDATLTINSPASGISYRLAYALSPACLADAACRQTTSATRLSVVIPSFSQGLTRCQGDTVFVGSTPLTTGGNHRTVLKTADGTCDSIVSTFLNILPAYEELYLIDLCLGEQFRGRSILADTTFTEHFMTVAGCDSSETYEVSVAFATRPVISGPDRICAGNNASLEVNGAFASYAWSTGNDGDDAPVSAPGTYTLTLTDFNGCTLELSHNLAVTELVIEQANPTSPACPGGSSGTLALVASGDTDLLYSIDGGQSFQQDTIFTNLPAGNYELMVENADGCNVTGSASLTEPPPLNITSSLPPETTIERGDSLPLSLTTDFEVVEYRWNGTSFLSCDDCPNPMAFPMADTQFKVEAIAVGGCSVTDSTMVFVKDNRRFFAPTAFSPNGDDHNDRWQIFAGPRTEAVVGLQIADRWGGIRFQQQTTELPPSEAGWDGTDGTQPLPPGTYIYSATLRYTDGTSQLVRGQITLMR